MQNSMLSELESQLKTQFTCSANAMAQFYMMSMQNIKQSYWEGTKRTITRINDFLLPYTYENTSNSQRASNPNRLIPIATVLEFLEFLNQEIIKDEKGKEVANSSVAGSSSSSSSSQFSTSSRNTNTITDPFRNLNVTINNPVNTTSQTPTTTTNLFSSNLISPQSSSNSTTSTPSSASVNHNNNNNHNTFVPQSLQNITSTTNSSVAPVSTFTFSNPIHQAGVPVSEPTSLASSVNPFSQFSFSSPNSMHQQQQQQPSSHKRNFDTFASNNPTFTFVSNSQQYQNSITFSGSSFIQPQQQIPQQMSLDFDINPVTKRQRP